MKTAETLTGARIYTSKPLLASEQFIRIGKYDSNKEYDCLEFRRCGAKRITDVILALAFLAVLTPLLLIIALSIKIDSRGPVLFRQKRFGLHKKPFLIFKFRTLRQLVKDECDFIQSPLEKVTHANCP